MASFVRRVTIVDLDGGAVTATVDERKKRKVSRWLVPLERHDRTVAKAVKAFGTVLSRRQRKSNEKRRDGWLRDASLNLWKSTREGFKKLSSN